MTDMKTGRTWSDERHKVRLELRASIDQITATTPSDALTHEDIMQVVLEVAAAHFAWGDDPRTAARKIARLAHRIRLGDRLEL